MPRVFNYTKVDVDVPVKYTNSRGTTTPTANGTWVDYGSMTSKADGGLCDYEITSGQLLYSNSLLSLQKSCIPHGYNAGNYYNLPSQLGDALNNDICPKGWSLPQNARDTSYSRLLQAYGIDYNASSRTNQDSALLNLPLSFLRSGVYDNYGSLYDQGNRGVYRMTSLSLSFNSDSLYPTRSTFANYGYPVRCVAR